MHELDYDKIKQTALDLMARKYVFQQFKEQSFLAAEAILKGSKIETKDQCMTVLLDALSQYKDNHIRVIDEQGDSKSTHHNNSIYPNYHHQTADKYLDEKEKNHPITYGKIGDIRYIRIVSFSEDYEHSFNWLYSHEPPSEAKFIIDLRGNGGGNDSNGRFLAEFLLGNQNPALAAYIKKRTDELDPKKLSEKVNRFVNPYKHSSPRSVAVLTSGNNYSAAEMMICALAAIPGTTLIGNTTGGCGGVPRRYLLNGPKAGEKIEYNDKPSDFSADFGLDIPSQILFMPNGHMIQWNGIAPHINIPAEESIKDGRDYVLEAALNHFKK